jgi:hypothetical protein
MKNIREDVNVTHKPNANLRTSNVKREMKKEDEKRETSNFKMDDERLFTE